MRVVNLSQRPFLNRRPVLRVAVLLWVVGGLILLLNVWLFAGYLSGTTKNRERLAELGAEIDAAETEFDQMAQRLSRVSLGERNQRAAFLNELIDQRTFPWSRLFDDLEDALHDDVYLSLVSPRVDGESKKTSRSRSSARRMTPREARERARRQRARGGDGGGSAAASMPTPESANVDEKPDFDVVTLTLQGTARSDEALLEFVDALYENESFLDPFLSTEDRSEDVRGVNFAITTYYLLPRRSARIDEEVPVLAVDGEAAEAEDAAAGPEGADAEAQSAGEDAEPASVAAGDDGSPGASGSRPGQTDLRAEGQSTRGNRAEPSADVRRDPPRNPLVRRPGEPIDRGRPSQRRDRSDIRSIEDLRTNRADGDDGGSDIDEEATPLDSETEEEVDRSPELTEPAASASPRLKTGSLTTPARPVAGPAATEPTAAEEARA